MKAGYSIIIIAIISVAVVILVRRHKTDSDTVPVPKAEPIVKANGMNVASNTDPNSVFRKVFWRNPADGDEILDAERREWSMEGNVRKWQWFIAVRPGPQLREWLESNPFSLLLTDSHPRLEQAPEWFPLPSPDFEMHQNAGGSFLIMLSPDRQLLYATDSGSGFTPPSPAP